jgi:hypothetical protein
MKRLVHVNVNLIRFNKKHGTTLAPCRVQEGSKSRYCREVHFSGPSKMVYSPDNPLPCGARLWIETDNDVELIGEVEYSEIREAMQCISKKM